MCAGPSLQSCECLGSFLPSLDPDFFLGLFLQDSVYPPVMLIFFFLSSFFFPLVFPPVSASRCATTAHSVFCRQQALRTSLSCVLLRQTSLSVPRFLAEETTEKSGQTRSLHYSSLSILFSSSKILMLGLMGQVTLKTWVHYKQSYPWAMCTAYAETRMGFVFRCKSHPQDKHIMHQ